MIIQNVEYMLSSMSLYPTVAAPISVIIAAGISNAADVMKVVFMELVS